MAPIAGRWSDEHLELWLGTLLRAGVVLASTVVVAGAVLYVARHGFEQPLYHVFRGEPSDLRTFHGILSDAMGGQGRGIIQAGLLLLIATPVMRVVVSVGVFALQRDWRYVLITLVVLSVLLYGLAGPYL